LLCLLTANAGAAGFGPPQALDLPVAGPLVTAVGADGEAVVAGMRRGGAGGERVMVATRARQGASWNVASLGPIVPEARDLQAIVAGDRVVLFWSEVRRERQSVVLATGRAGGTIGVLRRLPVRNAFSASPRLARLRSGAVVLAWHDGRGRRSRVRVATLGGSRFTSGPRTVGTDAAQVVLAAHAGGATVGWTGSYRGRQKSTPKGVPRARPRRMTIVSLDASGAPTSAARTIARDVDATVHLAGAPDGRLVASWLRPQKILPFPGEARGDGPPLNAYVPAAAFTRQVLPRPRPARPVPVAGQIALGPPGVALLSGDRAALAVRANAPGGAGINFGIFAASSRAGGPWSDVHPIAQLGFSRMDPVVVRLAAQDPIIVYTAASVAPGTPRYSVSVDDATGTQILGTTPGLDGRGVGVASTRGRALVAWLDGTGVQVAERF
jgi:hypothetical protein